MRRLEIRFAVAIVVLGGLLSCGPAPAFGQRGWRQEWHENEFDEAATSWRIEGAGRQVTVLTHARSGHVFRSGGGSELFRFSTGQLQPLRLTHETPRARVFEELEASVWVRSNRAGAALALRVRFPHEVDPRTGESLAATVLGETYSDAHRWQQLTCRTSDAAMQEALVRLRNQLRRPPDAPPLDTREAYVDGVMLLVELQPGATEVYVDALRMGPMVQAATPLAQGTGALSSSASASPRVVVGDDHLRLDGRPFIPRIARYHGEPLEDLARSGINVVWIPRHDDDELLAALDEAGLYAMTEPPRPPVLPAEGGVDGQNVGLISLSSVSSRILFWNAGTRIPAADVQQVAAWGEMVRLADYEHSRPLFADVTGSERQFHRQVDCLGMSKHILHTSFPPAAYREYLEEKRALAFPDKPTFTHIQTEPAAHWAAARWSGRSPAVVEPEQIWLQGYTALAAGYKALSYWKETPLSDNAPGSRERRLAVTLMNRHVALLEPWLATGKVTQTVPASVTAPGSAPESGSRWMQLLGVGSVSDARTPPASPIRVSVLRGDYGLVLLPVWYEEHAQYQPGPMTASELHFTIAPIGQDVLQAWSVTTTDVSPAPVRLERITGGLHVTLTGFDQHAAIVITSNAAMIETLRREVAANREAAARDWVELSAEKLQRVGVVDARLRAARISTRNGEALLAEARRMQQQAETALSAGDFRSAAAAARSAMAHLRAFQRGHWEQAVEGLASGVSSPYAVCFQTLPDHWELISAIGRREMRGENLLKSGEFEDPDTMFARGWRHEQIEHDLVRTRSELHYDAHQGDYCLRLLAQQTTTSPVVTRLEEPAIRWSSPSVPVYAGQIVHISGHIRIAGPVAAHPDGLVIYDSLLGPVGALRWNEPRGDGVWEPFQLIREVRESGDMQIAIELRGLGDVRIDDLRVVAFETSAR